MTGLVIVISGPGGVGKGTVVAELVAQDSSLALSQSWTTRDQRPGEADNSYNFVTESEFRAAIEAGGFLEWDHHFENFYGSPVPAPTDDDLVLEIDVNGARTIYEGPVDALFVFIDTPSIEVQRERMIGRGDSIEKVDQRLAAGQIERDLAEALPYLYVVNDDVERCAREIAGLIDNYRRLQTD